MRGISFTKTCRCAIAAAFLLFGAHASDEGARTRVNVTSRPSGASVFVDGASRGTTPVVLFDLKPGRHHLKCRLPGYVDNDSFFTSGETPFISQDVALREETGLLLLKTDPPGCDIQIDGVSVGTTPRLVTGLAVKDTYNVKFRKAGYLDQSISVKFEGRKPVVRNEKMVLASGMIDILSEPSGAEVSVNGIVKGKTPLTVADVPKGRAIVRFKLDGFAEEVRDLSIKAGDRQTLPVALRGLPGTIHLVSVPEGARFYVNDEAHGKGPLAISGLKPGEYVVRAEMEGYGTLVKTIVLENGASAREEFRLSNVMGRLEVRTCPPDVQVIVDGHVMGVTKAKNPDAEYSDIFLVDRLLEGEHQLVMRKDGYEDLTRHPKIQNSKTARYHRQKLVRIFVPDVEIITSRGSYKGVLVSNTPELVTIEVRLGITQSFSRDEIRKINFLKAKK